MSQPLWTGFLRSADAFPDRPAVATEDEVVSYADLCGAALRVAATLQSRSRDGDSSLTAVLGERTPTAFAGVLGALLAGNGYVPLNPDFPVERTRHMLESSGCRSLVVDRARLQQAEGLLDGVPQSLLVIAPDVEDASAIRAQLPAHTILGAHDLSAAGAWAPPHPDPDALAYLLFTSGSTGKPKGVMVAHRNVRAFLDYMLDRYEVTERDRLSQMFDLTFDLSVFDMFMSWERGACICCPSKKDLISPGRFIKESDLTIWFSVPSTAVLMKRLGLLKPDRYPSLRLSLFCGEALPTSVAAAWQEAAPASVVENLYGPTELTIACTLYRWDHSRAPYEAELDVVPIGHPYPGMQSVVVDESLREVAPGEVGELVMRGPQMSLGYWQDPEKTAAAFVELPDRPGRYYRTGDRVRRPHGDGPLTHLGRVDFQVKIRGHRVELGEIEAAVRDVTGLDGTLAVAWPPGSGGYAGVEVFVEGPETDVETLRKTLATRLPDYMVPRRFHFFDRLPRNVNDKFDRKAVAGLLEEGL